MFCCFILLLFVNILLRCTSRLQFVRASVSFCLLTSHPFPLPHTHYSFAFLWKYTIHTGTQTHSFTHSLSLSFIRIHFSIQFILCLRFCKLNTAGYLHFQWIEWNEQCSRQYSQIVGTVDEKRGVWVESLPRQMVKDSVDNAQGRNEKSTPFFFHSFAIVPSIMISKWNICTNLLPCI